MCKPCVRLITGSRPALRDTPSSRCAQSVGTRGETILPEAAPGVPRHALGAHAIGGRRAHVDGPVTLQLGHELNLPAARGVHQSRPPRGLIGRVDIHRRCKQGANDIRVGTDPRRTALMSGVRPLLGSAA